MGVLTDLIVAPMTELAHVGDAAAKDRPWPWVDVKGIAPTDLTSLHCLIDGADPNQPVAPPEWRKNPFTKQMYAVTVGMRYAPPDIVWETDDGECSIIRLAREIVNGASRLDANAAADLARRWSTRATESWTVAQASEYLGAVISMAKIAIERGHELFLWSSV